MPTMSMLHIMTRCHLTQQLHPCSYAGYICITQCVTQWQGLPPKQQPGVFDTRHQSSHGQRKAFWTAAGTA